MNTNDNHAEARECFNSRLDNIRDALADPEKLDGLTQDCLAVETRVSVHIQLSTGGLGDGFEIICDARTGEPLHGCHYFVTWGFRKEIPLSPDELANVCAAYGIDDARLFIPERPTR